MEIVKSMGFKFFVVLSNFPFNTSSFYSDVFSFIHSIGNFCLLSFFSVSPVRGLLIALIFQRTSFWCHQVLSIVFPFSISLIFALYCFFLQCFGLHLLFSFQDLFLNIYFIDYAITVVPFPHPFTPLHPAHPLPPTPPPIVHVHGSYI